MNQTILPSRINPFLSLSQIRSLTVDFASLPILPTYLRISSSRFDATGPLSLDNLQVHYQDGCGSRPTLEVLYSFLLPQLNPVRCTFHAFEVQSEDRDNSPWIWLGTSTVLGWSRLTHLDIIGLIPYTGKSQMDRLVGLSPPSVLRRLELRLHVASFVPPCHNHDAPIRHWDDFLMDFGLDSSRLGLKSMRPGSFVLVVRLEEEKRELKEAVQGNLVISRWRSAVAVEVEL